LKFVEAIETRARAIISGLSDAGDDAASPATVEAVGAKKRRSKKAKAATT
jgi:hypothetical protein